MDFGTGMAISGGLGLLGALAGGQGSRTGQSYQVQLAPASALENQAGAMLGKQLTNFQGLVEAGPGMDAVKGGMAAQQDFASMLQQYMNGGANPTAADMATSNAFAKSMFGAQQTGLDQQFADAQVGANRQAARMGRLGNDPILMNKLLQEKTRQQSMLNSQMGAFATQHAMNAPMQRLQFGQQYAQVQQGLASQAMANRQALLSMGSNIKGNEMNFRAGTASKSMETTGGGGLAGMINGGLAGAGVGFGIANSFGAFNAGVKSTPGNPWSGNGRGSGPLMSYQNPYQNSDGDIDSYSSGNWRG